MTSTANLTLADLVREVEPEAEFRFKAQAEALRENKCRNPLVGQLIDVYGAEYLMAVLDLGDFDFAQRFPSKADLGHDRRQQMRAEIGRHLSRCKHCSLAHGFDLEADARILRISRQYTAEFMQLLDQEEVDLSESEHLDSQLPTIISEHHTDLHPEPELIINPVVEPI